MNKVFFLLFFGLFLFAREAFAEVTRTCWKQVGNDFTGSECNDKRLTTRLHAGGYADGSNETNGFFVEFSHVLLGEEVALGVSGRVGGFRLPILRSSEGQAFIQYGGMVDLVVPPWNDTNTRLYFSVGGAIDDLGKGRQRWDGIGRISMRLTPFGKFGFGAFWEFGVFGFLGPRTEVTVVNTMEKRNERIAFAISPAVSMGFAW